MAEVEATKHSARWLVEFSLRHALVRTNLCTFQEFEHGYVLEPRTVPDSVFLELEAGEVVLLHNWTLHRCDVNKSEIARRGLSVCYMDAATQVGNDRPYTKVFGQGALTPDQLTVERNVVQG